MRFVLSALVFLSTASGFANDGSPGCGPGWYLFKDNSIVSSAFRATTNTVLVPLVTLGMTFGTSNCTQHKIVLKEKESLHFATMNHFELKANVAQGQGEYLSAFAVTMGCPATIQRKLNQSLRSHFSTLYPDGQVQPEKVLFEVYKVIFSDKEMTLQCSLNAA